MKQGTLFYDRERGRYNFYYKDEDLDFIFPVKENKQKKN